MNDENTSTDCAEQLVRISRDLRQAGDVQLAALSDDGVGLAPITLADELWLIAFRLDGDRTMALGKELDARENA